MATITSSTGLISGINTGDLISKLIALDAAPVSLLQTRITSDQTIGAVYQSLGSQLQTLQTTTQSLEKPDTFDDTAATSSNPSVLTANTSSGAAVGTYTLRVARTVTTQQLVTGGFTDATTAKVGAGTITLSQGSGGNLTTQTALADLNGGAGVSRGTFRITDRSGASAVIDTSGAVSLDDVVADINSASTISVRASIKDNHLVLTDTSGQTASNLIVQDLGTGTSAASLGIVANVASSAVTGTDINAITKTTLLSALNDGRGVATGGNDFTITNNGNTYTVNLATAASVGDVITAIKTATGGAVTAAVSASGSGLTLTANGGTVSVAALSGSKAAAELGLTTGTAAGSTLAGSAVLSGIDSTLLSSLAGGAGLALGTVSITDAAGTAYSVDLSGASDVQDVLDDINTATDGKVVAAVNSGGTGLALTDASGGTGSLTVAAGTTATALGLAGTSTTGTLSGTGLDKQWLTDNTLLSTLNGGQGIGTGTFTITTAAGASAVVTVSSAQTTVGDLLYQINNKGVAGLTASVNATGNGIEIADASGGAGQLSVTDTAGAVAASLNIKGTAATGTTTIDGAYAKTITVGANDTLTTAAAAINAADAGVTATIINDGSSTDPYRLSITSDNSGTAGAVTFDAGTTGLATQTLVAAADAAVFVGGSSSGNGSSGSSATTAQPLLVTSSSDTLTGVIQGVTLNLLGVSSGTVQLTVAADADDLVTSLTSFTSAFNTLSQTISSQSTFNTSSDSGGLLLGDLVALQIQSGIFSMLNATVANNGGYPSLYNVGFGIDSSGDLTFDESTFRTAFAADPTAVENLFTASTTTANTSSSSTANSSSSTTANSSSGTTTYTGVAYAMDKVLTNLIDPVSGVVTGAESELTTEEQGFSDRITQLNALLAQKQAVYETQFADMESALATLDSISSTLTSIGDTTTTTKSSS